MLYKARIDVLVECDSQATACDAIAEGLRNVMHDPNSCWRDWQYGPDCQMPFETDGSEFVEYEP